jgi:hypothetical protein
MAAFFLWQRQRLHFFCKLQASLARMERASHSAMLGASELHAFSTWDKQRRFVSNLLS